MTVSTVDGTIVEAVLKRSRRNLRIYERVVFRLPGGTTRTWLKAVVDQEVARLIQPGASGRFYLFTAADHRGIHGVRDASGAAAFAFPRNNETAMLIVAAFGALVSLLMLAFGQISFWALFCMGLGIPFFFIYRGTRLAATRQYEADAGYRPPTPSPTPAA
jgi:hypothetical protein